MSTSHDDSVQRLLIQGGYLHVPDQTQLLQRPHKRKVHHVILLAPGPRRVHVVILVRRLAHEPANRAGQLLQQ